MHDPATRRQLAVGRLDVIEDADELDDHERELVQAAAAGYPGGRAVHVRPAGRIGPGRRSRAGRRRLVRGLRRRRALHRQRLHRGVGRCAGAVAARSGAGHRSRPRWRTRRASPRSPSAASTTTPTGYYSTGEVRFGTDGHFWTYPERMSPLFGAMVAESMRTIFDEWTWAGLLDDVDPLTILELGGGEGRLALDVLDHVWSPSHRDVGALPGRVCATCSATAARPCASARSRRSADADRGRPGRGPRTIDAVEAELGRTVPGGDRRQRAARRAGPRVPAGRCRRHRRARPRGRRTGGSSRARGAARLGLVRRATDGPGPCPTSWSSLPRPGRADGRAGARHR